MLKWKLVKVTGRSFARKDGKYLVVGHDDNGCRPTPRYWFAAYQGGEEIAQGSGYGSREEAQAAAEAI